MGSDGRLLLLDSVHAFLTCSAIPQFAKSGQTPFNYCRERVLGIFLLALQGDLQEPSLKSLASQIDWQLSF